MPHSERAHMAGQVAHYAILNVFATVPALPTTRANFSCSLPPRGKPYFISQLSGVPLDQHPKILPIGYSATSPRICSGVPVSEPEFLRGETLSEPFGS